jgi:hypothetical protein
LNPARIWIEQCEAARDIEGEFGTQKSLAYLVGEKFLNYLEAAENDPTFRAEIPAFVAEIKRIFEPWQLAEYLQTARQTGHLIRPSTKTPMPKKSRWSGRRMFARALPICC